MKILLILILLPVFGNAQNKGFNNFQAGVEFLSDYSDGISFRFSRGRNFDNFLRIGAGTGISKIKGISGVYLPLFAIVHMTPLKNKKVQPVVSIQPGIGVFGNGLQYGFNFFGGGGIGFSAITLMVGYSSISYKYEDQNYPITRINGISIRAGVTF
jgi:hypothetical protein